MGISKMNGKLNFDEVKKKRVQTYLVLNLPLDTARANLEFNIPGQLFYVLGFSPALVNSTAGGLSVRFNEPTNDPIEISLVYRKIATVFYRFFITNTAAIGFSVQILIAPDDLNFLMEDFSVPVSFRPAQWPSFQNITCVSSGTGYPIIFGNNVKKIWFHARSADMKIGATGASGTTYITLVSGATFTFDNILIDSIAGNALEVQSATAGAVLEVMTWA